MLAVGFVIVLTAAACGAHNAGAETGPGSAEVPAGRRYRGTLTVLESPEHGPQLCGVVLTSNPPQCSGPDVVGWDWDDVPDAHSARGTTWGSYEVTGTWDGERLTLTGPPGPPQNAEGDNNDVDFSSPCPEPAGGWRVIDPATTNQQTLGAANEAARARDDFAGAWVDQSINPAVADGVVDPSDERAANDLTKLILNVRVTGDVAAAERDLRTVWGGALCVSGAERTYAELASIQQEIWASRDSQTSGAGLDVRRAVVVVSVFIDDGLQAEYDQRYGTGTVVVRAILQPID